MLPSLRSRVLDALPLATFALIATLLPFPARCQSPSATSTSSGQKPQTRQITVITNENIGLSLVSHAAKPASPASPPATPAVEKAPAPPPEDPAKKAAEIAALRKQIKDKQKRIELLMHLFVTDERKFVQSPTDTQTDPDIEARVRAEQEELRAESAACALLQARLDALLGTNSDPH